MDALFLSLLIVTPLLILVGFYRLWCLTTQKLKFKNKVISVVYISSLILVMFSFIYYEWYFFQCVWPSQCGEGFASGYIAAGVIYGISITTAIFIVLEIILFFAVGKRNEDHAA